MSAVLPQYSPKRTRSFDWKEAEKSSAELAVKLDQVLPTKSVFCTTAWVTRPQLRVRILSMSARMPASISFS